MGVHELSGSFFQAVSRFWYPGFTLSPGTLPKLIGFSNNRITAAAKVSKGAAVAISRALLHGPPLCWHLSVTLLHCYNSLKKNVVFYQDQETWLHKVQISLALHLPCPPHVSTLNIHSSDFFKSMLLAYLHYSPDRFFSFSLEGALCVYLILPDRCRF